MKKLVWVANASLRYEHHLIKELSHLREGPPKGTDAYLAGELADMDLIGLYKEEECDE